MEATVCCRFYYWSEIEVVRTNFIVQSTYTSAIEQLLLKWNGCDCDGSMHDAIGFTVVMWQRSKNWIGGAEQFQLTEVARPFLLQPGDEARLSTEWGTISEPGVKLFFEASANISARFRKQAVHDKTTSSKWIRSWRFSNLELSHIKPKIIMYPHPKGIAVGSAAF